MKHLPHDGLGLVPPADADLAHLRRWAAARYRQRFGPWRRAVLLALMRLVWPAVLTRRALRFARRHRLGWRETRRLVLDCLAAGAEPNEALVWRRTFRPAAPHPLPGKAATLLLSRLGDPAEHALLADKLATGQRLAAGNLRVPTLLATIGDGSLDPDHEIWSVPRQLVIKPRRGWGGRHVNFVDVFGGGWFSVDGGPQSTIEAVRARIAAAGEDLLVQARVVPVPELADLTAARAPVLRLTTARDPSSLPFMHSALLTIAVPDENPRHFVRGQLHVPVVPQTGRLVRGIWFLHAGERFASLPWNGAPIADRLLPGFARAAAMAIEAMALFPGLPLVSWDVILSADGPVILEGNSRGDWILTNLGAIDRSERSLPALLRSWAILA